MAFQKRQKWKDKSYQWFPGSGVRRANDLEGAWRKPLGCCVCSVSWLCGQLPDCVSLRKFIACTPKKGWFLLHVNYSSIHQKKNHYNKSKINYKKNLDNVILNPLFWNTKTCSSLFFYGCPCAFCPGYILFFQKVSPQKLNLKTRTSLTF